MTRRLMVLRNTRHLAITQSHQYYVNFNPAGFPAGTIQVTYQPPAVGGGALPPLQQVKTYTLAERHQLCESSQVSRPARPTASERASRLSTSDRDSARAV